MAGTSIARLIDNVSAIFGNPAVLTEWTGTEFTFGATYCKPEVWLHHNGGFGLPTLAGAVDQGSLDVFALGWELNEQVPLVVLKVTINKVQYATLRFYSH